MFAQCTHMSDVYKCLCADVWCSTIPSWIRACTVRVSASPWGTLSHVILGCFYKLCFFFYPLYPMRPQMYSPFYAPSPPLLLTLRQMSNYNYCFTCQAGLFSNLKFKKKSFKQKNHDRHEYKLKMTKPLFFKYRFWELIKQHAGIKWFN